MKEELKLIIKKYGHAPQIVKAIEEMSELQKELCKHLNCKGDIEHIEEEIADVEIMIEQLKIIFLVDPGMIENIKKRKIERTMQRMNGNDTNIQHI